MDTRLTKIMFEIMPTIEHENPNTETVNCIRIAYHAALIIIGEYDSISIGELCDMTDEYNRIMGREQ